LTLAMPERAEFYLRLAERRMGIRNEQVALPVLAQIKKSSPTNRAGVRGN